MIRHVALLSCFIALGTGDAFADEELRVHDPFVTSTSHDNMRECDPELTASDLDNLTKVRDYYYEITPAEGGDGSDSGPDVNIQRTMVFDIPEISLASIGGMLAQGERDSCEFHLRFMDPAMSFLSPTRFVVQYHMHASFWECGSFLGISYKIDKGTADADSKIVYRLNPDLQVVIESQDTFNVHIETSLFVDILSIAIGPMGIPMKELFKDAMERGVVNQLNRFNLTVGAPSSNPKFMALTSGNISIQAYLKRLDLMHAPAWELTTSPTNSGFKPISSTLTQFALVQSAVLPSYDGPFAYQIRRGEIMFIRDLAKPKPRMHVVARGESLWKIANQYYPDPHAFLVLEQTNRLRNKRLKIGQTIIAPLLYETCKEEAAGNLVLPGDTIYALRKRYGASFNPKAKDYKSRQLSLIYPYERVLH